MPEIPLLSETDRELVFAHRPLGGWVFCAIGASVFYAAFSGLISDATSRWWFGGMGAFFAVVGLLGAFWRHELSLDLVTRTYRRRKGFWPHAAIRRGPLDDLEGVVLTMEMRRSSSSKGGAHHFPVWVVSLAFRGEGKPVSVMEDGREVKAYQRLETLAERLRLPAIDRTGGQQRRISWETLDRPLQEELRRETPRWGARAGAGIPPLPPGSAIEVVRSPGGSIILLPAPGFSLGTVFFLLFGSAFVGFGGIFLWAKVTGRAIKEGAPGITWVIGPLFLVIGLVVFFLAVAASRGRMMIREDPSSLAFGYRVCGRPLRPRRVPKGEIEEIRLRPVAAAGRDATLRVGPVSVRWPRQEAQGRTELFVRSDREVVRLGEALRPEEQEWLRQTLLGLLAGS